MSMLRLGFSAIMFVTIASAAEAQGLRAVRPLPGYACMSLNLSPAQLDDNSVKVPILTEPSSAASRGAYASETVIAVSPPHVVSGYAEVLRLNGERGWISAQMLKPWRSASNPSATCTPSMMSNGKPGFG